MPQDRTELTILVRARDLMSNVLHRVGLLGVDVGRRMVTAFRGVTNQLLGMNRIFGITIGLLGPAALARHLQTTLQRLDAIAKTGTRLGVTVESLQQMELVAGLAGVQMTDLSQAMTLFSRNLSLAEQGMAAQSRAFALLGIDTAEFKQGQLDIVDVVSRVSEGLEGIGSATQRTALLMDIFGESGAKLGAVFAQGSAAVREFAAEATELGIVLDREQLARVEALNDSWLRFELAFRGVVDRIVVTHAPRLTALIQEVTETFVANQENIEKNFLMFTRNFGTLIVDLAEVFAVVGARIELQLRFVLITMQSLANIVNGLKAVLAEFTGTQEEASEAAERFARSSEELLRMMEQLPEVFTRPLGAGEALEGLLERVEQRLRVLRGEVAATATVTAEPLNPTAWEQFIEGVGEGIGQLNAQWANFVAIGTDAALRVGNSLVNNLSTAIVDGITKVKSWGDAFKEFGKNVLRILLDVITRLLVVRALSAAFGLFGAAGEFVGGLIGGGGGGGGGSAPPIQAATAGTAASLGIGPRPLGQPTELNVNIFANDSRGFDELLVKHKSTLADLFTEAVHQRRDVFLEVRR